MKECIFLQAVSSFESFKYEINLGNKKLQKTLYFHYYNSSWDILSGPDPNSE